MDSLFADAPVISRYTRAQAIEDGILIDLRPRALEVCQEHFGDAPVACTASVWGIIQRAVANPRHCIDLAGVVHDICHMSKVYARPSDGSAGTLFRVTITGAGRQRLWDLKRVVAAGDAGEPTILFSLPNED